METLKIKKVRDGAIIPTRAHAADAGLDLYAMMPDLTNGEKQAMRIAKSLFNKDSETDSFNAMTSLLFGMANVTANDESNDSEILIGPHKTIMIPTGIAIAVPDGYMGCVYARSGLASKKSLAPANCVGVIDSAYRGEVMVALHNYSGKYQTIKVGERIAQLVVQPISLCQPIEVDSLDTTDRGDNGFGSTGK